MKFACDVMLGRLARWLRASGHDVFYANSIPRSSLLRVAREEGRTVITRAGNYRELSEIPPCLIVAGDGLDEQLEQVYRAFPKLDPFAQFLTRCMECNAPLEEIEKDDFRDLIPPKALLIEGRFSRCPACGKLLWPGSHVKRMRERLENLALSVKR
jgi:uncharacterized protein with PIN domain